MEVYKKQLMQKSILVFALLLITTFGFSQEMKVPLCGTTDSQIIDEKVLERMRNVGKNPNVRMADLPMLECIVSVAVEYNIYLVYNKNQELIKEKIYRYFDKVSKVYQDEMNIKFTVNHIEIIRTQRNDTLQKSKAKLGYHIGLLFKSYDAVNNFAAGISIVTKSSDGQYDLYCISGYFDDEPLATKIMAHEIGHCFDSPHTHNCNWPNGPIDICEIAEGGCLSNAYLNSVGSIMSYCPDVSFSFHPYNREVIRSRADEILSPILVLPNKPIIEISNQKVSTHPYLLWKYNTKTTKFQIQISDNQTFNKPLIDSTIFSNFFQAFNLTHNNTYFWRIKAINHKGGSDWSEIATFLCDKSQNTSIPIVKGTFLDKLIFDNVRLEIYEIPDVNEYEFRLTDLYNYNQFGFEKTRLNNNVTFRTNSPIFNFKELQRSDFYHNIFYWQARAIKNGVGGEWTPIQKFQKLKPIINIYPKQSTKQPTTFPIAWSIDSPTVDRIYTLQVSEDEDFTKIHTEKTRKVNTMGSRGALLSGIGYEIIENLKPNTTYFYRFRENKLPDDWQVSYFKTAKEVSKWKFLNKINQPFEGEVSYFTQNTDSSKIIFANNTGIYQTDGVNWDKVINPFTTKGLVSPDIYTSIKVDSKNNLYFNQTKVGLVKYDGTNLVTLSNTPDFYTSRVSSILIDKNDDIYAGTVNSLGYADIRKYSNGKWELLPLASKLQFYAPVLRVDNKNTLWATIGNEAIYKFNGSNWENIIPKAKQYVYGSFTIDSKNNLWWIDLPNNEYVVHKKSPDNIESTYLISTVWGQLPYGYYYNIISDKKGMIWLMGVVDNKLVLFKFQDEKWIRIDSDYNLPLPLNYSSDYAGMAVDKQNRIWIFSNNFGIFIYDDSGQVKSQTINAENIVNRKYTSKPFKIIANASSGLLPSYKIISGPAKVQKDSIILSGQVGKVTIQISQSGNEIYEPAKNVELSFNVIAKEAQNINFGKIEQKTLSDKTFTLNATSTSGLAISYQIISGPATVNANIVTLTGTGKVIIKAKQDGNGDFLAANEVTQEFCVIPAKPKITPDVNNNWLLKVDTDKNIQWYFEGKKIPNATQSSLLATENGKYYVEIVNTDAACASNASDILQLLILSNENNLNELIKIFPNPATDWLTVESKALTKIDVLKLYDSKGRLLYNKENLTIPHQINIQDTWKGNALIEIKANNRTFIKKVILQ